MNQIEVLDRPENSSVGSVPPAQAVARRVLKIENLGDTWRGNVVSGIRLKGQWLTSAGFHSGERVAVTVVSPGLMELKSVAPSAQNQNSPDLRVSPQGSVWLFYALTELARQWMTVHCPPDDDHQYFAGALVVEARYVGDILQHANEDGLVITQ